MSGRSHRFLGITSNFWEVVLRRGIESVNLGGTLKFLSLLVLEINTFFFRKDKFGIILKVIICCFIIRVLWGYKPGPTGQIKGR